MPTQYMVTDEELTAVANAIRMKGGTEADLEWYSGFVSAIGDITGGGGGGEVSSNNQIQYPDLPSGYTELEYLVADTSYPRITVSFQQQTGDLMRLQFQKDNNNSENVIVGKRSSGWNYNIKPSATDGDSTYGNISVKYRSWKEFNKTLDDVCSVEFQFTGTYDKFDYGQWGTDYHFTGKLYPLFIRRLGIDDTGTNAKNTELYLKCVLALIPCYRNSDNVNGFYDTVNDQFYTAVSGTFISGPEGTGYDKGAESGGESVSSDLILSQEYTKWDATINGVKYGSTGAVFDSEYDYIIIPFAGSDKSDITIYIDVSSMQLSSGDHRRFVMGTSGNGFIYRSNGKWAFYNGSWEESNILDGSYFDNCKVKIYIDSSRKWHIYKDNVLVFEPSGAQYLDTFTIGSYSQSINNATISGIRIYNGNYTETT